MTLVIFQGRMNWGKCTKDNELKHQIARFVQIIGLHLTKKKKKRATKITEAKNQRESNSPAAAWLQAGGRHVCSAQTILEPQDLSRVVGQNYQAENKKRGSKDLFNMKEFRFWASLYIMGNFLWYRKPDGSEWMYEWMMLLSQAQDLEWHKRGEVDWLLTRVKQNRGEREPFQKEDSSSWKIPSQPAPRIRLFQEAHVRSGKVLPALRSISVKE